MECNKEEAIRLLDLAENQFKSNDFEGAKKLALKAQRLFPSLPNIYHTITAYEVHIAAAAKNWHAVLQVDQSVDLNTIKKQFKNMCLLTHPDKNCSIAAAGAFKLVTKAWSILSTSTGTSTRSYSSSSQDRGNQSSNWRNLHAEIKCRQCGLSCSWDFSRMQDDRSLFHNCKVCGTWAMIRNRLAMANAPLACKGCKIDLKWGAYQPFGYECNCCGSYYAAGIDPNWMPNSQSGSFRNGWVLCPFWGAWNDCKVANGRSFVSCKQCGLKSIIQLEIDSSSSSRSSQSGKRRREY